MIEFIKRASNHSNKTAIVSKGKNHSFSDILERSAQIASRLLNNKTDLNEARIAFIIDPSFEYVATQWGIWRAGRLAIPLCTKHPLSSLEYVIDDTQSQALVYSQNYSSLISTLFDKTEGIDEASIQTTSTHLPDIESSRNAMILYTSGTTRKSKGVVTTHENIQAQIKMLINAWEWSREDKILNVLPLHHVHGIINVVSCALWSGSSCHFQPKFDEAKIFEVFKSGQINLFMAVPTIYHKLINYWKSQSQDEQEQISKALSKFRLMVSGSAALPISTLEEWRKISGQILLERYGMTEMGMAISNPYDGLRVPGNIGFPLEGMNVRLVNEENKLVESGTPGEIQLQGPNIFKEYWGKPEVTKDSFVEGWFKTGDLVEIRDDNYFRIIGRKKEVINVGGEKVLPSEVEDFIMSLDGVVDCTAFAVTNGITGQAVGIRVVPDKNINEKDLKKHIRSTAKINLENYKVPVKIIFDSKLSHTERFKKDR